MALASEETRFSNLLVDIKNLYLDYMNGTKGTTLSGVATFKKGVLGQNTVYPAITVIPESEIITERRSGGQQVVARRVRTEIYHRGYSPENSNKMVMDDEERIRNIFFDSSYPNNYKFTTAGRDTTFNFELGEFSFDIVDKILIQTVSVPITFYSFEYPSSYSIVDQVEEETKDFVTTFTSMLSSNMTNVKFFYNTALPPVPYASGTCICVREINVETDHYEQGRDRQTREFHIYLWSKLTPFEQHYMVHLDTVDTIKDVLHSNMMWSGRSWYSKIIGIHHGINQTIMMYGTQFVYKTSTRAVLPSY